MLRSETLFGKRETNTSNSSLNTASGTIPSGPGSYNKNASGNGGGGGSGSGGGGASNQSAAVTNDAASTSEGGSKLIVGPNIKLKGVEITDCDTLVVEGRVEATIDSRVIQIAACGAFKGTAEFDIAEIHGEFDGDLTVREKLVIYATGKVSGKVRYGKLVIEEGGQLSGDVQMAMPGANKNLSVAKVG